MTMSLDTKPEPDERDLLFDVLGRISTEIRDVTLLIERLEPMLSSGRSTEFLQSPEHMRVLQGIDLAVQKTRGLAVFIDTIGAQLDATQLIDITTALNLITLADMKKRLRAAVENKPPVEVFEESPGDLEFF